MKLVESHGAAVQAVANGIHAVPEVSTSIAAAQAAYRFLNNPRVSLRALAAPLIELARRETATSCDRYLLVVHDWTQLMYSEQTGKKDRIPLSGKGVPEGYEALTSLLVSDRDGSPIAPVAISLRAADGVHCSRSWTVRPPLSPLDELDPAMSYVDQLSLPRPTVHLIDAEADSVFHYREWSTRPGRLFVVRADDRIVEHGDREWRCSAIQKELRDQGTFHFTRPVVYRGKAAEQYVAEVPVRLTRPGQRNRPRSGDRRRIPGPHLSLRLIISEVRSLEGVLLATWFLLSSVPLEVDAATIALWYYWRWTIETFFKLLKSGGQQVEQWQQTTAGATTRRILVASMACTVVWRLARSQHPLASETRRLLVRLSGRQMKHGQEFTLPSMLAGLWVLLAMMHVLEKYTVDDLRAMTAAFLSPPPDS